MYLVNLLKECIGHIEKGEFDPVLNDAIIALRVYVDEKSRNIEVAVAASVTVTPTQSRSNKRKLQQIQHIHQDNTHNTNSKNSIEDTVIPYTQKDAISSMSSSSSISNKRPKSTNHIDMISPSLPSLPQSQLFESEDTSWNQRLSEMKSYIHRNKGTLELDIDKMGPELFIWTYTQSTMYKSNLLSESRKSELAQIDEFVMFSNAESGGFDTINNEVNNDNDMNHQSTNNKELQVNDTLQSLEASIEIEEPANKDDNISTTNPKPNSKDTSKRKQRDDVIWNDNLSELKAYIQRNNTLEGMSSKIDKTLYHWVINQKVFYRNTVEGNENKFQLSEERMNQLNQIKEFVLFTKSDGKIERKKRLDAMWNENLSKLKNYIRSHNTLESMSKKRDKRLYDWVTNQKIFYINTAEGKKNKPKLSQERMDQLNQIKEFVEYCKTTGQQRGDTKWNKNLLKLKNYIRSHNTLESMSRKRDKTLYDWVITLKLYYRNTLEGKENNNLSQDRMNQLNQIKEFVEYCKTSHQEIRDKTNDAKWSKMLEDLKAYIQRENKSNNEKVTMEINKDKMGETLYRWVTWNRFAYVNTVEGTESQETLPQRRMDKLNEVKLFVKCCNDPEYLKKRGIARSRKEESQI